MTITRKKVCIIGAGVSGLPAIKSCLEEGDLDVVCYEKTSEIGGLWNYRPNSKNIGATVMKSTVVNTSKEMMAYSDFPPPTEWPNFMHHSLVQQYLEMYAKHFDLLKHIQFDTEVQTVKYDNTNNQWVVKLKSGPVENFDALMLCTGHHSIPQYPKIAGLENFKGRVLHAQEYRDYKGFEDKNVFIVGIGNSALDISVEIAKIAKNITISTRRGSWIFNRVAQCGMPYDVILMSRVYNWLIQTLPWSLVNDFMEHRIQQRMDHDLYGLRPNHRFFQQHPTVNDALANHLASGMITITEDISSIERSEVIVADGQRFPADIIILATGYTFAFPYLEPQSIIPIDDHKVDLYKFVFPPNYKNLAILGLIQPIGSIAPISEMQSRWAAKVFSNQCSLPSETEMLKDIAKKREIMQKRYFRSNKHTLQVDFIPYMDELAELIGCKPSLKKILLHDPRFALQLFVGANAPYVYRLFGPNCWAKARDTLYGVSNRVKFPLKNRACRIRRHKRRGTLDEYFRYASMKWIAGYSSLILCAGIWVFCASPTGISTFAYFSQVFLFIFVFSFMLLWFDIQYDMTTIF